jgi:hypothetical protein
METQELNFYANSHGDKFTVSHSSECITVSEAFEMFLVFMQGAYGYNVIDHIRDYMADEQA